MPISQARKLRPGEGKEPAHDHTDRPPDQPEPQTRGQCCPRPLRMLLGVGGIPALGVTGMRFCTPRPWHGSWLTQALKGAGKPGGESPDSPPVPSPRVPRRPLLTWPRAPTGGVQAAAPRSRAPEGRGEPPLRPLAARGKPVGPPSPSRSGDPAPNPLPRQTKVSPVWEQGRGMGHSS